MIAWELLRGSRSNTLMDPCRSNIRGGVRTPAALTPMHVMLVDDILFWHPEQSLWRSAWSVRTVLHTPALQAGVYAQWSGDRRSRSLYSFFMFLVKHFVDKFVYVCLIFNLRFSLIIYFLHFCYLVLAVGTLVSKYPIDVTLKCVFYFKKGRGYGYA